ncbi:hypothetical protein JOD54_004625 [Actinokineospora baliensis]|nr:hypothetical protein [Actinokineospora baliensis]MBM7774421.1 hypothetical protein [Actinokineospora baliensis]
MANNTTAQEATTAPSAQNSADLWTDNESEEIVSTPKMCAYDPLTRL